MSNKTKVRANVMEVYERCEVCDGRTIVTGMDGKFEACLSCKQSGLRLRSKTISYINVPIPAEDTK